jgi:hypothetical protein
VKQFSRPTVGVTRRSPISRGALLFTFEAVKSGSLLKAYKVTIEPALSAKKGHRAKLATYDGIGRMTLTGKPT